jgi:hypothetical protein
MEESKSKVFRALYLFLILASLFLLVKTYGEFKSNKFVGADARSTISVSGVGEVFASPDVAEFSFSVIEEADTVAEAQIVATENMNAALSFLKEHVEEKYIKTTGYSAHPRYEYQREVACLYQNCPPSPTKRVLVGYQVSQNVTVKVKDIDLVGTLLAGIGEHDVDNISGPNFSIENEDSLKREARQIAIDKAQKKARNLAKDLGVKLVRIINFSEGRNYPVFAEMRSFSTAGDSSDGKAIPEIPVGENSITSNVNIIYEIK